MNSRSLAMIPDVDTYLAKGCGRCVHFDTPSCKVFTWHQILVLLRQILLSCGLKEEIKWSVPCYTLKGKNILILAAFREHCSLNFFKGSLMEDPENLLVKPGEQSQAARFMVLTSAYEILRMEDTIRQYVFQAITLEEAGAKVTFTSAPTIPWPEELVQYFEEHPAVQQAFEALTPGKQRGYLIYFTSSKQPSTRLARIVAMEEAILKGWSQQEASYAKKKKEVGEE